MKISQTVYELQRGYENFNSYADMTALALPVLHTGELKTTPSRQT